MLFLLSVRCTRTYKLTCYSYREGQLNPTPEKGLQPILPGAYALAKGSKRPIQMVGLYGMHKLWHADENIGMKKPVGKDVKIIAFPPLKRQLKSAEGFIQTFTAV